MDAGIFQNGILYINGKKIENVQDIEWDKHPRFEGVFTKNIFTGKDSSNCISAMMVKIEPDCEIGNHIHQGKAELHEIISGSGFGTVGGDKIEYKPGIISLIPADINHSVKAGAAGLMLLAKFTPALN